MVENTAHSCHLRTPTVPHKVNHKFKATKTKKKVLPGLEPGLQGSEPWVLTNYTIEPLMRKVGRGKKKAPRVRLELTTYRLTAGRAADCAIQEHVVVSQIKSSTQRNVSSLLSLVVEHSLCKRKVGGSIPPVGLESFCSIQNEKTKRSTSQRFELWRAEPIGFQNQLLNHSDTMSLPRAIYHIPVHSELAQRFSALGS